MKESNSLNEDELAPEYKIDFASKAFSNVQHLIQFMDQKGAIVMAIITFLGTGLFTLVAIFYKPESLLGVLKWVLYGLLIWYIVNLGLILFFAIRIFIARPNILKSTIDAPQMIFPLMLLEKHEESDEKYLASLKTLTKSEILKDFSNEIVMNSKIYELKQKYVNRSYTWLMWSLIPWTATIIIIFYIIFFKN